MFLKPRQHRGVFVGGVVVADQIERFLLRGLPLDLLQEVQPLLMPMSCGTLGNHAAIERAHRGKQRGGAAALVVVGHRLRPSPLHRQTRLGAIKCLHLSLLVQTEYHFAVSSLSGRPPRGRSRTMAAKPPSA